METLRTPERIPTNGELTKLVDSFEETVKCLMDVRHVETETTEDVKLRHKDTLDSMDTIAYGQKPLSAAAKYYRKTVLEDGTEIRFQFNPDNPLNDGAVPVKVDINLPEDKHIKISSLKDARLRRFGVTNYDKRDSYENPGSEKRLHGYQFAAGENIRSRPVIGVDGFRDISEDTNNAIRLEILQALHKLIVEAMYQPYQKPVRNWFQKLLS
ncbi:MAG: hypothetical protein AAB739_03840 [Patescibacteria group bacterium]